MRREIPALVLFLVLKLLQIKGVDYGRVFDTVGSMKTTHQRKVPIYWKPLIREVVGAVIVFGCILAIIFAAFAL